MKILIIDRDELTSQMISSRLAADEGIVVVTEAVKSEAIERLEKESFDVVMVDPNPMKDAQAMIMNIRRTSQSYPYIVVLGKSLNLDMVANMGANNYATKPLDPQQIKDVIRSAETLQNFSLLLADASEDFPSAGGVIAKSAFNQLYLSAIDRGWRYAEKAYVLSVSVDNYEEIKTLDGDHHATYGVSKLAHHLVKLRRQSDVIGQVEENKYSLLLQRTAHDTCLLYTSPSPRDRG